MRLTFIEYLLCVRHRSSACYNSFHNFLIWTQSLYFILEMRKLYRGEVNNKPTNKTLSKRTRLVCGLAGIESQADWLQGPSDQP